jgi:nicotinate-nucleotide pyrophosphorylase (carboxylating)
MPSGEKMIPIATVETLVRLALEEDIGSGDITAGLVDAEAQSSARVITREPGVLCGTQLVNEVFRQLDPTVVIDWSKQDGDLLSANDELFRLQGNARSILTGERTALNFLQLLSGTATRCQHYADLVEGTGVKLLDTRKTIPGLRLAQKYAVTCGGCHNHRVGLYDAFLIKENHIEACGGIAEAVATAKRQSPGKPVEVEVESIAELQQAIDAGAERIMLDNFSLETLRQAVQLTDRRAELEASGNVNETTLRGIAETGVDYISIGALTKGVEPLDLSLRITD